MNKEVRRLRHGDRVALLDPATLKTRLIMVDYVEDCRNGLFRIFWADGETSTIRGTYCLDVRVSVEPDEETGRAR